MAKTVTVDVANGPYDIVIDHTFTVGQAPRGASAQVLLVSDDHVAPLYGATVRQALEAHDAVVHPVVLPSGETTKSLACVEQLYAAALAAGLDRRSTMMALGGGVIGDLTGFAAATYLRGIAFVQVPTTLLAMVDSSVGGKTGINLPAGKNLVGAFYQPRYVDINVSTLATLPEREYRSGLAEVVKYGIIWDAEFFTLLERELDALLARDRQTLESVIARCCEIKADVVAIDERESGVRAILNFGHTLGHALENLFGYGVWTHGEAVAAGMAFAAQLSVHETGLSLADCDRIFALLRHLGLPVELSAVEPPAWEAVRNAMACDKKSLDRMPRFVLARKLGDVVFGHAVAEEVLREHYQVFLK